MKVLMKLFQLILENNKAQNHTKIQCAKILKTLTLMKLEQKVNTTKWRPIYEVIDEDYIKYSKIFLMILLNNVKIIQTKHNLYRAR